MSSVANCKKFTGSKSSGSCSSSNSSATSRLFIKSSTRPTEAREGRVSKLSRLRLRVWLQREANSGSIPGLVWLDSSKTELCIPWLHGSKQTWSLHDVALFQRWAEHTGRYSSENVCPKKWKANFRCALKSLSDVIELPCCGQTRGKDAYRVYKFLPLNSFPVRRQGAARKRLMSQIGHVCHKRHRTISSCNSVTESVSTSSCTSPTHTAMDSEGYYSGVDEDFEEFSAISTETSNTPAQVIMNRQITINMSEQVTDDLNNETDDDDDTESLCDYDTSVIDSCNEGIEEDVFGLNGDFGPADAGCSKQCANVATINSKRDVSFQCLQLNCWDGNEFDTYVRDHTYATAVDKLLEDDSDFNCPILPPLELSLGLGELNDFDHQEI